MTINTTLGAAILVGFGGLGFFLRHFLAPYLSEKGKNLATKEDVEELTRRIESVRADIDYRFAVRRLSFAREFKILHDIWSKLEDLRLAILDIRPVGRGNPGDDKREILAQAFANAFNDVFNAVHRNRPFYPAEIYAGLKRILDDAHREGIDFEIRDRDAFRDIGYWQKVCKLIDSILHSIDEMAEIIHKRVFELGRSSEGKRGASKE